jgi:hypothetical protein
LTRVVADTHVHLHPCYDLGLALVSLCANLARHGEAVRAGFLAERGDHRIFTALRDGSLRPGGGFAVQRLPEAGVLLLESEGRQIYLFGGRQIVTAERIEVLALGADIDLADGLPAERVIAAVQAADGVPVIGWSPGKWSGSRGRLVGELLRRSQPGDLLLGDTALRPRRCPEPRLMREARRRGLAVIAGTDPLPLPGEERLLGTYASVFEGPFDTERPLQSARNLLRSPGACTGTSGSRGTWVASASRWLRHARLPHPARTTC